PANLRINPAADLAANHTTTPAAAIDVKVVVAEGVIGAKAAAKVVDGAVVPCAVASEAKTDAVAAAVVAAAEIIAAETIASTMKGRIASRRL
ncbi:MAG: hypothetical protein GY953_57940, partial [bacterium]|nr:hypothetical protein [bacterium]